MPRFTLSKPIPARDSKVSSAGRNRIRVLEVSAKTAEGLRNDALLVEKLRELGLSVKGTTKKRVSAGQAARNSDRLDEVRREVEKIRRSDVAKYGVPGSKPGQQGYVKGGFRRAQQEYKSGIRIA